MRKTRFLSFILSAAMLLSAVPVNAENKKEWPEHPWSPSVLSEYLRYNMTEADKAEKRSRDIRLYTVGNDKVNDTETRSTVYVGDTVHLYFAVDNPNKGIYYVKDNIDLSGSPVNYDKTIDRVLDDIDNAQSTALSEYDDQKAKEEVKAVETAKNTFTRYYSEAVLDEAKELLVKYYNAENDQARASLETKIKKEYKDFLKTDNGVYVYLTYDAGTALNADGTLKADVFEVSLDSVGLKTADAEKQSQKLQKSYAEFLKDADSNNVYDYLTYNKDTALNSYGTLKDEVFDAVFDEDWFKGEYIHLDYVRSAIAEVKNDVDVYNTVTNDIIKEQTELDLLNNESYGSYFILDADGKIVKTDGKIVYKTAFDEKAYRESVYNKKELERRESVVKDAVENSKHLTPMYDMNGYTVKIYYDPDFFDLADTYSPLIYNQPGAKSVYSTGTKDENVNDETEEAPVTDGMWLQAMGSHVPDENSSEQYAYVYARVFASGIYFPNEEDSEGNQWYNLCELPLIPKQTGRSDVYIETDKSLNADGTEKFGVELFAKNETTDLKDQTFDLNIGSRGRHTIIIQNKPNPGAPRPDKPEGTYTEYTEVYLELDERDKDDCKIYYSINGDEPNILYTGEAIPVSLTTTIRCKAVRYKNLSDEEMANPPSSSMAEYTYKIRPNKPDLYVDAQNGTGKNKVTGEKYYHIGNEAYLVYPSTDIEKYNPNMDYEVPGTGRTVHYTFKKGLTEKDVPEKGTSIGANPEEGWVELGGNAPSITIPKGENKTLYMIVHKQTRTGEIIYSDIAEFELGFRPEPAQADPMPNPPDGEKYDKSFQVRLFTPTEGAVVKYTLNGDDPKDGIIYQNPITVAKDTKIRAIAWFPGTEIYSDETIFQYLFSHELEDRIDAFHPAGTYEGAVKVTLTAYNSNDIEWFYKLGLYDAEYDASNDAFKPYNGERIDVDRDMTIYARVVYDNGTKGDIYAFPYVILPRPAQFAPESTQFTNSSVVHLLLNDKDISSTAERGPVDYTIYYTLDGSEPDPNNTETTYKVPDSSELGDDIVEISVTESYTVIKAIVVANYENSTQKSITVTHAYEIVVGKPKKPMVTLPVGPYTRENGDPEEYKTYFLPVPTGTKIYYTISHDGTDPGPASQETGMLYDFDNPVPLDVKGQTIIRAIAVDGNGVSSSEATFTYTVTPQTPEAAPTASIDSNKLPVVPVTAVPGSKVTYVLTEKNGTPHEFTITAPAADGKFYVDINTGIAYPDKECSGEPLTGNQPPADISDYAQMDIWAELDKVKSGSITYVYQSNENSGVVSPPFPDKQEGMYEEIKIDEDMNVLRVNLDSLNKDTADKKYTIFYRFGNDPENVNDLSKGWKEYDPVTGVLMKEYTILQMKTVMNYGQTDEKESIIVSHVYRFKPLPPYFDLESGTYEPKDGRTTKIKYNVHSPVAFGTDGKLIKNETFDYEIKYRWNGSNDYDLTYSYPEQEFPVTKTLAGKSYVMNKASGERSDLTTVYYVVESSAGGVRIRPPYDETPRVSVRALKEGTTESAIHLEKITGEYIEYSYKFKNVNSPMEFMSQTARYDALMPIVINPQMEWIEITAQAYDKDGKAVGAKLVKHLDFIEHDPPKTNLATEHPDEVVFDKNTSITLKNEYPDGDKRWIYFTTDGSDPAVSGSGNTVTVLKPGENWEMTLTQSMTNPIRAVYRSSCEKDTCYACKNEDYANCEFPVFGYEGTYKYYTEGETIIVGGGGGGGGTVKVDKTRKYTKDIFGNEHPTHIGYIKGYPDGSVRPEGDITREEVTVILYRIKNKDYEEPFVSSGDVFPDVIEGRWSLTEIEYMADHEVVEGYPDGEFKPSRNLTRAEFSALVRRFAKIEDADVENIFDDLKDSHWAYGDIIALYNAELMEGYEDGTFRPEDNISRAEVMTVINKLLGRNPSIPYVKSLDFNPFNDLLIDRWYYVTVLEATITHDYYLDKTGLEYKWENWK